MLISGGLGELQVYSDGAVSWVFVPASETIHSQDD